MTIYLVTYDLNQPGQRHQEMAHCLEGMDSYHLQRSVWLVRSVLSAKSLNEHVKALTDWNDKLGVLAIGADFETDDPVANFWIMSPPAGLLSDFYQPSGLEALSGNNRPPADAVLKALLQR